MTAEFLPRGLEARISEAATQNPVLILEGPRASGKTTLVQKLVTAGSYTEYRSFADEAELAAAQSSPTDYVASLKHGTVIDEAQLVEDITLPIKALVDADPKPGRFLLTGSSRLRRTALGGSDPLAGRTLPPLKLFPLTLAEKQGKPANIVDLLFEASPNKITPQNFNRNDLANEIRKGGLPGIHLVGDEVDLAQRHQQYLRAVIALPIFKGRDIALIEGFFNYICANTGALINFDAFAKARELDRNTVKEYIALFEDAMLLNKLPGWRSSKGKSELQQAKYHVVDTGLATSLGRMNPSRNFEDFGNLAETLVANELAAQSQWSQTRPQLFHWRYRQTQEIDILLQNHRGDIVCVEVKSAQEVDRGSFKHIKYFRSHYEQSFAAGYIFYTGKNILPFGDNLWAIPMAALLGSSDR